MNNYQINVLNYLKKFYGEMFDNPYPMSVIYEFIQTMQNQRQGTRVPIQIEKSYQLLTQEQELEVLKKFIKQIEVLQNEKVN